MWCGYTQLPPQGGVAFTEADPQVLKDVDGGYKYVVRLPSGLIEIHHVAGELFAGEQQLLGLDLPDWSGNDTEPWSGWWHLCATDAAWYRDQRRAN